MLREVAESVGKGLFAGAVGTAAMTISSTLEAKARGRESSSAPADAASKVLGIEPTGEKEKARFSNLVHWGYGTGWGAPRGVLSAVGFSGAQASSAHFAALWSSELVMLPKLGVAPPIKEWGAKELAVDVGHHLVYVAAAGLAYAWIDGR